MKKTSLHIITLVIALIIFLPFTYAQQGNLNGKVSGYEGVLEAATITIEKLTTLTDKEGHFSINLNTGHHTIVITHAGYSQAIKDVVILDGKPQTITIHLQAAEGLGEVVVLGSRSVVQRSNLSTPVPVDVFSSSRLRETGQMTVTQMLNIAAPSFNASRELLNEPATLRGLDPQHVLILLNGRRYHNIAWYYGGGLKGQLGRGSAGNDLNSIPFSSIEKIEILRDGASAQYGSDAIAGVINVRLKESSDHTSIRLHSGQYYKGDGEKFSLGIHHGISLHKQGFLNFSGDVRYQTPTFRGGEYLGTVYRNFPSNASHIDSIAVKALDDSIIKARGFNRGSIIDNFGNLKIASLGFLVNGNYSLRKHTRVFLTANVNHRNVRRDVAYRFPKNPNQVNLALYPDGYQAKAYNPTLDLSAIAGIKGETKNNWQWDFSSTYGHNSFVINISNTNNASQSYLGKEAPTSFYNGRTTYKQVTNDINFTRHYSKLLGIARLLDVAMGGEWRVENYRTKEGEEASWKNYDPTGKTQGGTGGIRSADVMNKSRYLLGSYLEIETELTQSLLFDIAMRYEYYSDFGNSFAGKLAARYKFSDHFMVRASVNNGFRAPSLQQRYAISTQDNFVRVGNTVSVPAITGTFPNDHEVTKALGIPSLTAERSINVSGGFTAKIGNRISMTVDAYLIQIRNRIILSGAYNRRSNASLDSLLKRFPDLNQIDQLSFFSNAINTRTAGIDFVLNGLYNFRNSTLSYSLAANINRTYIFGNIQSPQNLPENELNKNILFNRADRATVEEGQPSDKIALNVNYEKGKVKFVIANTHFGRTIVFHETTPSLDELFTPKILTDVLGHFKPNGSVTITLGANNILNVYPDRLKHYENTNQGSLVYSPDGSPFEFNGGYYFIAMALNL
jgi:iron complex outermembrane recepter protein